MNVETLMSRQPKSVLPTDSMNHAAQLMWDHDVGSVPVVDDERRVIGMLTDRDICMAAYTQGRPLRDLPVEVAMARQVISCRSDDDIDVSDSYNADNSETNVDASDDDITAVSVEESYNTEDNDVVDVDVAESAA